MPYMFTLRASCGFVPIILCILVPIRAFQGYWLRSGSVLVTLNSTTLESLLNRGKTIMKPIDPLLRPKA